MSLSLYIPLDILRASGTWFTFHVKVSSDNLYSYSEMEPD